jgi:hypothetical protein
MQVLKSNLKKLSKDPDILLQVDAVFKDQEKLNIIERVENLDTFIKLNPTASFIPHMPVFRPDKETTKMRVVFMSNLSETNKFSHNQAMHSGPCLNQKITTALIKLQFDEGLLCYDLRKAFLQLSLNETDKNKVMFLWFRNVAKKDYSIIGYRSNMVNFGWPCSPFLLMFGLHKILCQDVERHPCNQENRDQCQLKSFFSILRMLQS